MAYTYSNKYACFSMEPREKKNAWRGEMQRNTDKTNREIGARIKKQRHFLLQFVSK